MAHCSVCQIDKPVDAFYRRINSKNGLQGQCKPCMNERRNSDGGREADNARVRNYNRRTREELIREYGGKCVCCGEGEFKFLALDHTNGGGTRHRFTGKDGTRIKSMRMIQSIVKREGYPKDGRYQILCHNCNSAKGFYGACPHTQTVVEPPATYPVTDQDWFIQ